MKIKQQKLLLFFLKQLKKSLKKSKEQTLDSFFSDFFSREELLEILEYLYLDKTSEFEIDKKENSGILALIGNDISILEFVIYTLESSITATPTLSEDKKKEFFELKNLETHYLYSKPAQGWDDYDVSNYYSLLFKHGKTARVFAIFTSDVESEDKYAVTTKPSFFFDSKEEAETELEKIYKEQDFKKGDLKIMSLWKIQ